MTKPDYQTWDLISDFTLDEAAALSLDQEPPRTLADANSPAMRAIKERITREVPSHKAVVLQQGRPTLSQRWKREDMRDWANATGRLQEMPAWQTADERQGTTGQRPASALRADAERNLNALIGLLTLFVAKRLSKLRMEHGTKVPDMSAIAEQITALAKEEGISMDGLGASSLKQRLSSGLQELNDRRHG